MQHCRQRRTAMGLGLAGLAMSVAATSAYAAPIRFDNPPGPGHFVWTATSGQQYLTVLAAPASQPGTALEQGTFWRRDTTSGTTIRGRSGSVEIVQFADPLGHSMLVVVGAGVSGLLPGFR